MPVVSLDKKDLQSLTRLPLKLIEERLPMLGCNIERSTPEALEVEFFPDRPDLFSVEGAARALRAFLGRERGLRRYPVKPSGARMAVEPSVQAVRPRVAAAYVRGVRLDDRTLRSLIHLQEHLHWTIGRNRRRVAIGVHDASRVEPPLRYTAAPPETRFEPLDGGREMPLAEILREHPKGREYAFVLEGRSRLPLILDARDRVLSFPPVINAERTRVTPASRSLLVETTGFGEEVEMALNIVVTSLAERGGALESVLIQEGRSRRSTPDLRPRPASLDAGEASALLGLPLTPVRCARLLRQMGHGATPRRSRVEVEVPAYRTDVLHPWDLVEDIAKAWGFDRLGGELPPLPGLGRRSPVESRKSVAREVLAGMGFQEVVGFTLTRMEDDFDRMSAPREGATTVANPVSREQTMVRTRLLPTLLSVLAANKHRDHPQRLFEVGEAIRSGRQLSAAAAVSIHGRANFAEARSLADAFLRETAMEAAVVPGDDPAFIPGRCGAIRKDAGGKRRDGGRVIGHFGELHPRVLESFGLELPAAALEVELSSE